jgi:mono/diheme cytochrome c family protein
MPAQEFWWQRFHPVLRAVVAVAYFGSALAFIVFAVTPSFHDTSASRTTVPQEQASEVPTTDAEPPATQAPPEEEPVVLTGEDLYVMNCSSCHGASLEGGAGAELARGSEASEESDSRIFTRIRDGKDVMPAFGGPLSDDEIDLIVQYLRDFESD